MKLTDIPLPEGFKAGMRNLLGSEADSLFRALDGTPSCGVRFNRRKGGERPRWAEGTAPVAWCRDGFRLSERPDFTRTPQLHTGQFYVQDPSSMIMQRVVESITGTEPVRFLDLCAAPGGKTTAAINALPERSLAVANEYDRRRASILLENIMKWGYPDVIVTNAGAEVYGRLGARFDIVAVDAPCSGEGMMRKEPKARRQWSEGLTLSCARLQRTILAEAAKAVRPGGYLIYSTCTFNRTENEENAEWIVSELGLENIDLNLDFGGETASAIDSDLTCLRFMPHRTEGEGLFLSIFRKPGNAPAQEAGCKRRGREKPLKIDLPWIDGADGLALRQAGDSIYGIRKNHAQLSTEIAGLTRTLLMGTELATAKGHGFIPAHGAVLSALYRRGSLPEAALDEADALRFLRREAIVLPGGSERGITVVTHAGLPLGMVNNLGARSNNLYPQNWRIRI